MKQKGCNKYVVFDGSTEGIHRQGLETSTWMNSDVYSEGVSLLKTDYSDELL
jgi:hypothetical protein